MPSAPFALVVSVAASGPFLTDLLRWTESSVEQRVPTLVLGGGGDDDEAAARMILGRDHVRWLDADPKDMPHDELKKWVSDPHFTSGGIA